MTINRRFEIHEFNHTEVSGLPVLLTTSQTENSKIISNHWKTFNTELRTVKRNTGANWKKYGLTFRKDGNFFYMPSIPISDVTGFEQHTIPHGKYARFQHKGDMKLLKTTFYDIYKKVIPENGIKINNERTLMHFEEYDYRFKWNRPDSIIDIYLPVEPLKESELSESDSL